MLSLPIGTKIFCQKCRTHIATVKREIKRGDLFSIKNFDFVHDTYQHGDKMACKACGENFFNNHGQVSTDRGWK